MNSIWKNKAYTKFFASFTVGNIGDWFDFFALQIIFAFNFHANASMIATLMLFYILPSALFGGVAGMIVDRFNVKWLMFITDLISGFITLGLFFTHKPELALILVFARSCFSCINAPAQKVAVKNLVDEKQLLKASAYSSMSFQMCRIIGPLVGAAVVAVSSAYSCLLINAFSFWVSALILIFLHMKSHVQVHEEEVKKSSGFVAQLKDVCDVMLQNRAFMYLVAVSICAMVFVMLAETQMVLILKVIEPSQPHLLGIIVGVSAVASFLVGAYLTRREDIKSYKAYYGFGLLCAAIGYGVFSVFQSHWVIYYLFVAAFAQGIGFGALMIVYQFALQKTLPEKILGRVSGVLSMLQNGALIVGVWLGASLIDSFGARFAYSVVAVGLFVCVVLALVLPLDKK